MSEPSVRLLLSRSDVEEHFGISSRLLQELSSRGEGPAFFRIGRLVRYRALDVEAWIIAQRVDTKSGDHG